MPPGLARGDGRVDKHHQAPAGQHQGGGGHAGASEAAQARVVRFFTVLHGWETEKQIPALCGGRSGIIPARNLPSLFPAGPVHEAYGLAVELSEAGTVEIVQLERTPGRQGRADRDVWPDAVFGFESSWERVPNRETRCKQGLNWRSAIPISSPVKFSEIHLG